MVLKFRNRHVKQMTISVGTEYAILHVVLLICQKRTATWMQIYSTHYMLSRLNNASHILKRKHFVCESRSHHLLSNKGWRFHEWYHHTSLMRVNTSSVTVSFFWKVYHLIGLQIFAEMSVWIYWKHCKNIVNSCWMLLFLQYLPRGYTRKICRQF